MAILVDAESRILIQGITGSSGSSFARRMTQHGTPLVGGVTPGKGGNVVCGAPVFNTVAEAVDSTRADASLITVPASVVKGAFLEAVDAGIKLIWIYTENVPVHDSVAMIAVARRCGVRLIGPNAAGVASPGKANFSDLNDDNLAPGTVGIVSKSGTLTYEVIDGLDKLGLGVSTVVCLGGDPILGTEYDEILTLFENDEETKAIVLIGEIGGSAEVKAVQARAGSTDARKPLVAYIAGDAAPRGKQMGHAGAIVSRARGDTASEKRQLLKELGADTPHLVTEVAGIVAQSLTERRQQT